MKAWLGILVLLAFGSIAFMVFFMGNGNCVAEATQGTTCPSASPFDYVRFHLTAFSFFSTAVFSMFSGALAIILGIVAWFAYANIEERLTLAPAYSGARSREESHNFQSQRQQRSWLSILEKRDPASF